MQESAGCSSLMGRLYFPKNWTVLINLEAYILLIFCFLQYQWDPTGLNQLQWKLLSE